LKINCPRNCTSEIQGTCESDGKCKCNSGYINENCSDKVVVTDNSGSSTTNSFKKELQRLQKVASHYEKQLQETKENISN